jgi:hypothetical protein
LSTPPLFEDTFVASWLICYAASYVGVAAKQQQQRQRQQSRLPEVIAAAACCTTLLKFNLEF